MTASLITLPGTGEKVITHKNASDEHGQGVVLLRSDNLEPVTIDASGQKVYLTVALPAGDANIGNVDVVTVPADPFGANADAASATGSISAKLRYIAATGIPVTALPALTAGTAHIGTVQPSDGTNAQTFLSLTSGNAGLMAVADSDGDQVTLAKPIVATATPTLTTVTYAAGEVMGTVMSFADAAAFSAGTGHLTRVTIIDNDDLTHDGTNGQYAVHFFTTTVTVTNDAALAVASDAEAETYVGSAYTTDGTWVDLGVAKVCTVRMGAPLAYKCAALTLFGVLQAVTADSGASTAGGRTVTIQASRD